MSSRMSRSSPLSMVVGTIAAVLSLAVTSVAYGQTGQVSNPTPVNGATGVSTSTPLSWTAAPDVSRYDVRLGTTTTPPILERNARETTFQPATPLEPGTTYYWQVDTRGRGNSVIPGPLWSFTTATATPAPSVPSAPAPATGATNVAPTATLGWAASMNATAYDVAFGTTNTPAVVSTSQAGTSYDPPGDLAAGTTYFWRITAKGPGGSTPGPLWSFTTATATPAPSVPSAPTPATGATNVAATATLGWAASTNATAYDVAFGTTNTPAVVSTSQAGTSYDPPGDLAAGTTYFWRITAKGPGGSTPGPLWSFTTGPPPPASTTLDRLRLMTWNVRLGQNAAGTPAVDAQVELMADSGAHIIVLQEVTVTSTSNLPSLYESKLETLTGKTWYAVWAPAAGSTPTNAEGNLILSSLPPAASSAIQIDTAPSDPSSLDAKRSAAHVAVIVNHVRVNVFGTHLALDSTHRQSQLDTLQSWVSTFSEPRLIGGDFNMITGENAHTDMAGSFSDVWPLLAGADPGFTKDARSISPFHPGRIDYWWQENVESSARATEVWVVKTTRSDHHALLVDVEVK